MSTPRPTTPATDPPALRANAVPATVTGVQLMKGIGARVSKGFWAEAWETVLKRRAVVASLVWVGIVAFFAVFAPVLASGHPLWMSWTDAGGVSRAHSPLWNNLLPLDVALIVCVLLSGAVLVMMPKRRRADAAKTLLGGLLVVIVILAIAGVTQKWLERSAMEQARATLGSVVRLEGGVKSPPLVRSWYGGYVIGAVVSLLVGVGIALIPLGATKRRVLVCVLAGVIATMSLGLRWVQPMAYFNYIDREQRGQVAATYTLIPWSPAQRAFDLQRLPPGTVLGEARGLDKESRVYSRRYLLGTDAFGQDVLSQLLHACRLSISIGAVSTTIALLIGVTIGAMMGYFGGWVDTLLMRFVEVIMAVPVLVLILVAVAVLPDELKTTYVIMAIIGCFSWTGMARFTRAEFMKLRHQDFVQAAEATGVPLRSVLFKHMLPNGVAPVLVDTSFAVASAIMVESVLSYLGLGPVDSASWGKLLSSAISQEGEFKWWLGVFPGLAIFLTVLSYNLVGEALRDAIDPKLKKARV